jgi:putative ABC transport system permease protein
MTFELMVQELRVAGRGLRRSRGFTIAAVLTLAVGIAGTSVMFTLVQGVLLRPLPVRDQDRLLISWKQLPGTGTREWPFTADDIDLLRDESRTLERVAGYAYNSPAQWEVSDGTAAAYVSGAAVSGDFFAVLAVDAVVGPC